MIPRRLSLYIIREGEIVTSSEQHRQLLELCKAGDSKLACDYLRQHILQAMQDIKAMLKKAM
jgi:DNA-binding GntR family transcriptional regulator